MSPLFVDGTVPMNISKSDRHSFATIPRPLILATLIVLANLLAPVAAQDSTGTDSRTVASAEKPSIGTQVRDLHFTDIRALSRSMSDLGEQDAYVFVFSTSDCPLVRRYMPRLNELHQQFRESKVAFVLVNVGAGDSLRDIAAQAIEFESPWIFVRDFDQNSVKALGVSRTPEAVVLDRQHRICYRGRIDDQHRVGGSRPQPARHDLQLAIEEVLANKTVTVPETTADGCLITEP
ncbi:MAG: redoxin family protein, partial [Planctomycetaceae bacterium]|nr:redoxin family protein [Planctomycetaceae bacterium]